MMYSHTFNLRKPESKTNTLIYIRANIKSDGKYLKYSTGESISPAYWDKSRKFPVKLSGRSSEAVKINSIIKQLSRYSEAFQTICSKIEMRDETLTVAAIRKELDIEFKKSTKKPSSFYDIFDLFIQEKIDIGKISVGAIKNYKNIKNVLQNFTSETGYKITFSSINNDFYVAYVKYSRNILKHQNNTLGKYIGFIQSFMNWAAHNNYHKNYDFKQFEKPKSETDEIALNKEELEELYNYDFSYKKSLERVRDVFIFGCTTGMRYSDYSVITKNHIRENQIFLNSKKQKNNLGIPLNKYSTAILEKYNYSLPIISDQKFRDYLKVACKEVGFDEMTIKTTYIGNKRTDEKIPKYKRISTHTARRTFITLSLENGMRQDIVMSITGHKSLTHFMKYIKLTSKSREDAMNKVWG